MKEVIYIFIEFSVILSLSVCAKWHDVTIIVTSLPHAQIVFICDVTSRNAITIL